MVPFLFEPNNPDSSIKICSRSKSLLSFFERCVIDLPKNSQLTVVPLNCGSIQMHRSYFSGLPNDVILEFPVFAFLIKHPSAAILFDTGLPPELWDSSSSMELTPGLYASRGSSDGLLKELEKHDYYPDMITYILNSHNHVDHAGGNKLIPAARSISCRDAEIVHENGDCDLFGDGAINILATPGHSSDHQSVLLKRRNKQVILTGDACFRPANLIDNEVPLIVENRERALRSLKRLSNISANNATTIILTSHDENATGEIVTL
jgi:N-acyl homoserine lactone hydrolase